MDDFWSSKPFGDRSASELAPSGLRTGRDKEPPSGNGFGIAWGHKNWEWDDVEALERQEFAAAADDVHGDLLGASERHGGPPSWTFGEKTGPSEVAQKLDSFLETFSSRPEAFGKDLDWGAFFHPPSSALSPPLTPHSPSSRGGDGDGALTSLRSCQTPWTFPTLSSEETGVTASWSRRSSRRAPRGWPGRQIYAGRPFPSMLHSGKDARAHYTPRPLLDPARGGTGLYARLRTARSTEVDERSHVAWINIGSDFQAVIPPLNSARSEDDPDGGEQFLWKSWEDPGSFRDQVEPLLRMCCSSCVPGGGCNPELALHSLHACQSDVQAALRMLLFESTSPTGDYHYSGSDVWTPREKNDFDEALFQLGKNFALIQEKVKSKTLSQCVEFYYLSTKHQAKRMKRVRREDSDVTPRQNRATSGYLPTGEEAVPGPPPAVSFPCLECGKVFSKVKSRNAHMKVHRKLPKAWNGRVPPQRAAPYPAASLARPDFLSANDANAPSYSYTCANGPNFQVGTMLDFSGSLQRMAPPAPVFNPSWRAFV